MAWKGVGLHKGPPAVLIAAGRGFGSWSSRRLLQHEWGAPGSTPLPSCLQRPGAQQPSLGPLSPPFLSSPSWESIPSSTREVVTNPAAPRA